MTIRERDHRADTLLLMACSFAVATSNSVIFAALGDLQDTYGFPDSGLGLIAGSGFLAGLLVQLFVSPFADRTFICSPSRFLTLPTSSNSSKE